MPRRKQGHSKPSATGGYLKKKTDTGSELIENESLKSFTTNNDLVFKIKKTISGTISNSPYHEKIEREHIDASKSLNDINMVSKHEVNNNFVKFMKEQDENSNRNIIENCCGSNYLISSNSRTSKNICSESLWNRSSLLTVSSESNNEKCPATEPQKLSGDSLIKKSVFCNYDSSAVEIITTNESKTIKTSHTLNDVFVYNSKNQISERQYVCNRSSEGSNERQTSDFNDSQMSGVSPIVSLNDRTGSKSDPQQMNYRISTSVIESKGNQAKDTLDSVMREEQNCNLPSSVYGTPASSIEKVLTGLHVSNKKEESELSAGKVSFLQEILLQKSSETVSYDSFSKQLNQSHKDRNEGDDKLQNIDASNSKIKIINSSTDLKMQNKSESSHPIKLKLHIPENFSNDDSNSSVLSSESQKTLKIPKITSPQILEQHISKIISENAAIVETLDPKWSRRYFKQTSLNSSPTVEFDPKRTALKSNRSEDKSLPYGFIEGSKLQSALLGGSEANTINPVPKFIVHPVKNSFHNDKISQYNNFSSTVPSVNMYSKIACSVSEDELKGSAIKSLLSLKQGRYPKHKNSIYPEQDSNSQHPQNPEGSIIKDLLLKSKFKDGSSLITDVDDNTNSNYFVVEGSNLFYKSPTLKCPNCSSEFSDKYGLDIHLPFCKSATKQIFSLRDNPERVTFKQTNAQKNMNFPNNSNSHISEDSNQSDAGIGPILKKQLLLPLSKSPPLKRRKVSDSVLCSSYHSDQSFANIPHYVETNQILDPSSLGSIAVSPHRNRSHSVHLFGGEVQIVDGDKMKRLKIQTSIPGAFTPFSNKLTESFGIKKAELNKELGNDKDMNHLPSVVVTIAQPVHNSGGTVHLSNCRSPSVSPVVTIANNLSDGLIKYTQSERPSSDYAKKNSQAELKPFMQKEPQLLNIPNPPHSFFPGPNSKSFSTIASDFSISRIQEFKPVEEIAPISLRLPSSPGNKPFYSPIFSTNKNSFELKAESSKESQSNCAVPTVIFTPSSPTLPTSDSDIQPIITTSISEPTKKFLAPTRPTSLPLKKKPFTMVGSTLISPETPRPKKTCIQLYLNGHAYTYLGLKCSTRSTYCCIYRPQPMFVLQETNPKLSMYSNWQVVPAKEELSGLTPGQMISYYCSKQKQDSKSITTTSKLGEPLTFTHSSYWTYRSTEHSGARQTVESNLSESEDNQMLIDRQDSTSEQPPSSDSGHLSSGSKTSDTAHHSDESNLRLDTDNTLSDGDVNNSDEDDDDDCQDDGTESLTDSSQPQPPKRVKIFEGGFKSNEDYTYVRGRGRGKYVCEECGIRCKKPSMLKKHIRTHTDLRPYKCKHCSFAFKTKGNLTKHMKSKAHHKKCTELGIIPVPTTTDDSQIDEEALAKQIEHKKTQFSDGEDADDDDDDETDDSDDDCESDASSMIISNPNSRMLTNGHSKKSNSVDKGSVENLEGSRGSESVSQQSEEQEAARSLLNLSAIGEPSQWSTSTGDLTDVASSSEAEMGSLASSQSLLSPQYIPHSVASGILPNIRSKTLSDQWSSTETLGHRPRSYSADIPLGGGKELLTKYKLLKSQTSGAADKSTMVASEFGSRDQYTRRYSISVAREARKPRVIQPPEWNALGLPTVAPKWPDDQPMDLSVSRDLDKYKSPYGDRTLLNIVTQEEQVPERHVQASSLELGLSEQYQVKSLPVLSPQIVDYDISVENNAAEAPLLSLTEDQTAFTASSTVSRPVYYVQDIPSADSVSGRKDAESSEDPPSPDIDYSVCSPVSPSPLDENSYYYSQESAGHSSATNEEMQSSSKAHAEFIVPSSSSSMEEGKCVCRICNKIFAKSSHLRLHVNIHYFERPFRCDNCAVSFRTKGHLQKHKRSVSHYNKVNMNLTFGTPTVDNPRPFKCVDCKIAFRIHGHLAKHLRSKMHIMKLECLGKLPFGMYAEMERSGVSLNEIDTTDCNNSLESLQVMAQKLYQRDPRRMRWQGPDQAIVEAECSIPVPSATSTLLEPVLPISEPIPTAYDPSCSGIGLTMSSLVTTKHLSESSNVKHESSEMDSIRIPSSYTDGDSVISLPRYSTSQSTTPVGPETSQRAEIHENDSSVSLNRSGTCHLCGKSFKSAKFLQVHLYSDHSSVISSIGDVPASNNVVVTSIASTEMNCDLCGRMFPNQKILQQHLLSHAQPRPFVCEVCDAGFTSSSSLIAHQGTHQVASTQSSENRLVQLK